MSKEKITREMLEQGMKENLVRPVLEDGGLCCHIGDNFFYFGGTEFEFTDPKDIPSDVLIQLIVDVLDDFAENKETVEEYRYYYLYLKEHAA